MYIFRLSLVEDKFYLLKGNIHLWALDGLVEVFPDVCLIYIVRPMAQVIASFCSTYDHLFNYYGKIFLNTRAVLVFW